MSKPESVTLLVDAVAGSTAVGIGKSLQARGHTVVLHAVGNEQAGQLRTEARAAGLDVRVMSSGEGNDAAIEEVLRDVVRDQGVLHNVVLCGAAQRLGEQALATLPSRALAINHAAASYLRDQEYGRIVHLISRHWLGWKGDTPTSAVSGALVSLTRSLAMDQARHGITVNAVIQGAVDTPRFRSDYAAELEAITAQQPMRRLGNPAEVGFAVAFLLDRRSSYITGQLIYVCGAHQVLSSLSH